MEKKVSCGVIITDGVQLLAVRPFGKSNMLDIPKGERGRGETDAQAASRELFEETGIRIQQEQLSPVGTFTYTAEKNLSLFLYRTNQFPPINSLKCTSTFKNAYGRMVPEVVGYTLTTFDNPTFYRGLQPILKKLAQSL